MRVTFFDGGSDEREDFCGRSEGTTKTEGDRRHGEQVANKLHRVRRRLFLSLGLILGPETEHRFRMRSAAGQQAKFPAPKSISLTTCNGSTTGKPVRAYAPRGGVVGRARVQASPPGGKVPYRPPGGGAGARRPGILLGSKSKPTATARGGSCTEGPKLHICGKLHRSVQQIQICQTLQRLTGAANN
jgi:hypothetical protein